MKEGSCFSAQDIVIAQMLLSGDQDSVFADKGGMTDLQLDVLVVFRIVGIKGLRISGEPGFKGVQVAALHISVGSRCFWFCREPGL